MRAASFDLETTNLNGNFGIILCGCIKPFDKSVVTFRADKYKTWDHNRSNDSQISRDIFNELAKYDIWIAHNGNKFDVPFLRTRLAAAGYAMPQPRLIDPVRIARRYHRIAYNSLEQVSEALNVYAENPELRKTMVEGRVWNKAALDGDRRAMDYIVEHCVADVKLLEKVADKLNYLVPRVGQFGSDI